MPRKSQAAMEFLMTYGWAILVVLAAIAALAYFGVLNPDRLLSSKCDLGIEINCFNHKIEPTQSTLVLVNNLAEQIEITKISVGACSSTYAGTMNNGEQKTYTLISCTNGNVQDRFKADINITYTAKLSGLSKNIKGNIVTKVE